MVPCVLYGNGENVHFFAHENAFRKLVYTPHVYTVKLDIEGKEFDAILQDIQYHPVKDNILHIDFLGINEEKHIKIAVPVVLHGYAKGVKEGGKLNLEKRRLMVKGLLKHLPDTIDLDVEDMGLGKVMKVKDITLDNLELIDQPNTVVASVKLTRAAKGMAEEAAAAEEGEAAAKEGEGTAEEKE